MSFFTAVFDLGQVLGPAMFSAAMAAVAATIFLWVPEIVGRKAND